MLDTYDCSIVSLSGLIEVLGEDLTRKVLSTFKSRMESDTEVFLREKAIEMEIRDVSRTYIAFTSDGVLILGFVTISIKCLNIPNDNLLSNKFLKHMNIDGASGVAQSYLVGQLSRSKDSPSGFGEILMDAALQHIRIAKKHVGCRLVRLDCHEELITYYEKHGFKLVSDNRKGSLYQMLMVI